MQSFKKVLSASSKGANEWISNDSPRRFWKKESAPNKLKMWHKCCAVIEERSSATNNASIWKCNLCTRFDSRLIFSQSAELQYGNVHWEQVSPFVFKMNSLKMVLTGGVPSTSSFFTRTDESSRRTGVKFGRVSQIKSVAGPLNVRQV